MSTAKIAAGVFLGLFFFAIATAMLPTLTVIALALVHAAGAEWESWPLVGQVMVGALFACAVIGAIKRA